jgi:hypothetical protein
VSGSPPQRYPFNIKLEGGGWRLVMKLMAERDWVPMRHRNELWLYHPAMGA